MSHVWFSCWGQPQIKQWTQREKKGHTHTNLLQVFIAWCKLINALFLPYTRFLYVCHNTNWMTAVAHTVQSRAYKVQQTYYLNAVISHTDCSMTGILKKTNKQAHILRDSLFTSQYGVQKKMKKQKKKNASTNWSQYTRENVSVKIYWLFCARTNVTFLCFSTI